MAESVLRAVGARTRWVAMALLAIGFLFAPTAHAQVPVTLYQSFAGNVDFTGFGNTLRTASDAVNPCTVAGSSSATLTLPAGATVQNAYLYWAGSGNVVDAAVTFGGVPVAASRTFTDTFPPNYAYFSGFADVSAIVTGAGAYTFSGLTVNTGAPWCGSSAVLSGWSVIVIYSRPAEPTRVINLYDGFQYYRGSSINLVASNFLTPTPLAGTGQHGHLTWEGDAGNSGSLGGVSENLLFAGNPLTDVNNPLNNQFNSTVNTVTPVNVAAYGVDLDAYNITPFLTPGQSTVTTTYSSGQDLVLLSAEIFSVPNVPVADLGIAKTHIGDFAVGANESFTITVTNNGPGSAAGPITVTDTLPAGLTYVSGTGTDWTCGAVGQDVTCTNTIPSGLASGASVPALTLTVAVDAAAFPAVSNTATVSAPDFDNQAANNSDTDNVTVVAPDLSTSTKSVVDLNGGDAEPGDTLRYTITLIESSGIAATNVSVTDDVPANVVNFTVTTTPAGSTNSSLAAPAGANATGFLDVTNITVPASGSVTVVFEVDVDPAATPGTLIQNTATITNPDGPGATPAAPDVTVSPSGIPGSGTKPLYLTDTTSVPPLQLTRVPPAPQAFVQMGGANASVSWTLSPAVVAALQIDNQAIPVQLYLSESGPGSWRRVQVQLFNGAALIGTVGPSWRNLGGGTSLQVFNVPNAVLQNVPIGGTVTLTVTNTTPQANRNLRVHPTNGANYSRVLLPANTIINVDSVDGYDAVYPGGVIPPTFNPATTVYVRASVSDPFGDVDITGAQVQIIDPLGTPVGTFAMIPVSAVGVHPKVYEYAYPIPAAGPGGIWTTRVTATEGLEAVPLTDLGVGTFVVVVPMPNLVVLKTVQTDPPGSFHIPGTVVTYTIRVTNMGPGAVDLDTVVITDDIPAELEFRAADFDGVTSGPIRFDDGTPASGLSYTFTALGDGGDDVGFQDVGPGYGYTPGVPFDGSVISIQINPKGILTGNGGGDPYFEIRFKARVR